MFRQAKKAASEDDAVTLLPLLEKIHPDERDPKNGKTLIWAAFSGGRSNTLAATAILRWGCSINDRDKIDQTLLHHAAESNYEESIEALLKFSPDPNLQDYGGYTPLYYAAWHCNPTIVKMLLESGADPKIKNKWGKNSWYPLVTKNLSQFADRANMQEVWDLLNPHLDSATKRDLDTLWKNEAF